MAFGKIFFNIVIYDQSIDSNDDEGRDIVIDSNGNLL
jgi:hypothetical protein